MVRTLTLSILFSFTRVLSAAADTYPGVLFENSILSGNYGYSEVHYEGLSWVANVDGRLPVSDSIFFTPGNSLLLKYTAVEEGSWYARIAYPTAAGSYRPNGGDILTFKLYVASNTESSALPRLAVLQKDTISDAVDLSDYIEEFRTNMWLNIRLPVSAIGGIHLDAVVDGVQLCQGETSTGTHLLYIDQIEFLPAHPPRVKLSSQAVLATATAYDRHIDLTWQLPLTPSIRYIKIYRSEDNEHFDPVAVRPVFVQKCTDFVPYPNKTYYYKIAWVDYDYLESPFSNVMEATTHSVSDSVLLDFMQAAHFNYFVERAEVNSGMHVVHFGVDDATVSVMETGLSILSHVVGVKRGFISRTAAKGRLERIVDFLGKVVRYHGAFPAKIDGRTGKGVFAIDSIPEADLRATAFLMQGLLVAGQYFQADSGETDELVEKINALWDGVAWNRFVLEGQETVLLDRWSPATGFKYARPMGGFGTDLICYILALASPRYALPPDAYADGLGIPRTLVDSTYAMELASNDSFSVSIGGKGQDALPRYHEFPYTNDTTVYGLPITVGCVDTSLMEAYAPFLAFDPRGKRDIFADYFVNNVNLTKAYKRRDNERGYGGFSSAVWGLDIQPDSKDTVYAINPAIASASYAYLPNEAIQSMRAFYDAYGQSLFTEYGFRKWAAIDRNVIADGYDTLNQAAVVVAIENGRSGLVWDLFSNHPDIKGVIEDYFNVE